MEKKKQEPSAPKPETPTEQSQSEPIQEENSEKVENENESKKPEEDKKTSENSKKTEDKKEGENILDLTKKENVEEYEKLYDKQMQMFKKEAQKQPIIGVIEPFVDLVPEFENSPNFLKKICYMSDQLGKQYFRRVRKDGSCFYRGYLFALAELYLFGKVDFESGKFAFKKVNLCSPFYKFYILKF